MAATSRLQLEMDLQSNDHLRIQRATHNMEPSKFLEQLTKRERPKWMSVIENWITVDVPRSIFAE